MIKNVFCKLALAGSIAATPLGAQEVTCESSPVIVSDKQILQQIEDGLRQSCAQDWSNIDCKKARFNIMASIADKVRKEILDIPKRAHVCPQPVRYSLFGATDKKNLISIGLIQGFVNHCGLLQHPDYYLEQTDTAIKSCSGFIDGHFGPVINTKFMTKERTMLTTPPEGMHP